MIKWKSVSEEVLSGDYFKEESAEPISVSCLLIKSEGPMVVPNRCYDVVIKDNGDGVCVGRVSSPVSLEYPEDTNAVADIANYYVGSYFEDKERKEEA